MVVLLVYMGVGVGGNFYMYFAKHVTCFALYGKGKSQECTATVITY
jgi:hypothetical protein